MKTADKMFKELGYVKDEEYSFEGYIFYEDLKNDTCIMFMADKGKQYVGKLIEGARFGVMSPAEIYTCAKKLKELENNNVDKEGE